jgi:hypothetical protein
MPRQMSPEREKEYQELYSYLDFYMTNVNGIAPNSQLNLANVSAEIIKKFGKSKALVGLRQAVIDTIEDLHGRPTEYIAILDDALSKAGALTASEIRRRYAASYQRILKRGNIKNETEYHLINGIVVDLTSEISADEREFLQAMLESFEHAG